VSLGDVESERDSLLEKLSDYDKVRQQLGEIEEREVVHVKNIEDLKTKQAFILVRSR
jgi:cell division protein FtsB